MQTARMRTANPRGKGHGLREEILQAAARLLADGSSRDGVTLRAIAREAGIAAPSIYPHFTDRDAILDAVVGRTFEGLLDDCASAADGADSGAAQVRAICRAYVRYAQERPGQYRILFERTRGNVSGSQYTSGVAAFELLAGAVARSAADETSTSTAPRRDAQALWAALHGLTTLTPATPGFPWRPMDELLEHLVTTVVGLRRTGGLR